MCSIISPLIDTAFGMKQQQDAAQYQKSVARYEAGLARQEQTAAEADAQRSLAEGAVEADRVRRKNALIRGKNAADLGAAGFSLDQGSTLGLLVQETEDDEHENNFIMSKSYENALHYQRKAADAANRAANAGAGMRNTGYTQAHSLLSGLSKAGVAADNRWGKGKSTLKV